MTWGHDLKAILHSSACLVPPSFWRVWANKWRLVQVRLWAAVAMDSQSSGRDGRLRLHGRQDNARLLVVCWFLENESGQGLDTH